MKKIAFFFNSPSLGGAERSGIYQTLLLLNNPACSLEVDYFVPILGPNSLEKNQLADYLRELLPQAKIIFYPYPRSLYAISRSATPHNIVTKWLTPIAAGIGMLKLLRQWWCSHLHTYDYWWFNGNKVGLVGIFLLCLRPAFTGNMVWHFRDYPSANWYLQLIWYFLRLVKIKNLQLVGNSHSVVAAITKVTQGKIPVTCAYNPLGPFSVIRAQPLSVHPIRTIGVVSMFAPWKNIHQILIMAAVYQPELLRLGIERINIYGDQIYHTPASAHQNYAQQLSALQQKFPSSLIHFCGTKSPAAIFSEIELLIHPSATPEPFGRVIIEAFAAQVVVLSSALGGAGELVEDGISGQVIDPQNINDIFANIQQVVTNLPLREKLILGGKQKWQIIEALSGQQIRHIFSS